MEPSPERLRAYAILIALGALLLGFVMYYAMGDHGGDSAVPTAETRPSSDG